MQAKTKNHLAFLFGLGSVTETWLFGAMNFTEIACYFIAPFLFLANVELFKKLRLIPMFMLLAVWGASAILSDYMAQTVMMERFKGWAPIYSIFAITVCATMLFYDDIRRYRWFLVGSFCSAMIASFVFTPIGVAMMAEASGTGDTTTAFGYSAWYYGTISATITMPVKLFFNALPVWVSLILQVVGMGWGFLLGGRSGLLTGSLILILLWSGRTARYKYYRPRRLPVMLFCILMVIVGITAKGLYRYAATQGYMGEEQLNKYEAQTKMGTSALSLLMAGRSQTFTGFFAALDKPLRGHGSKALDLAGYRQAFVDKYGDSEDVRRMYESYSKGDRTIPAHSCIIAAWLWHGLGGLLFWSYILWLLYKTATIWMWYAPEVVGWFAYIVPGMVWDVLFSPLGSRTTVAVQLTFLFLVRFLYLERSRAA